MEEQWKDILGYEGLYQVSSRGKIKSLSRFVNHVNGVRKVRERILKANVSQRYKTISLSNMGIMKRYTVHRLVAQAFIPNNEQLPEINHKDGDRFNNKSDNLEWCTSSYNQTHAYSNGLKKSPNKNMFAEKNRTSKVIIQYDMNFNFIRKLGGTREANRITGINAGSIASCARGERKTAGGYIWRYK